MRIASPLIVFAVAASGIAQGPWLGGQREILLGPINQGELVLGLYVNRKTGTSIGPIVNKTFEERRLGWMGWKVKDLTLDGKVCKQLSTDAFTTVVQKFNGKSPVNSIESTIKISRQTTISPNGKILRETYQWQDPAGTFTGEAVFGDDEVQLTVRGPGVNRSSTVFPAGGTALLDAMYTPMMKDGKVVLTEKDFTVMNPLTGGVLKVKATISGHFKWDLAMLKKKGTSLEIKWPDHVQKAFIDESGELLRVELPEGRYLMFEQIKGVGG